MIDYERALQLWGAQKLSQNQHTDIDPDTVCVDVEVDPGNNAEGSWYESPRAVVSISGRVKGKKSGSYMEYDVIHNNLLGFLSELLEVKED